MKAVIVAAGKGTRLAPFNEVMPKPIMPIGKKDDGTFKTIIERLIEQLVFAGVKDIAIIINYKGDMIKDYLKNGSSHGCNITYRIQDTLDGNAGAYYRAQDFVGDDDVIITDADNFMIDDNIFTKLAEQHKNEGDELTVAVSPVENIKKFAIIKVDENGKPIDIFEKPTDEAEWGHLAKSGIMMLSNKLAKMDKEISRIPEGEYTTTQIIKYCLEKNLKISLFDIEGGFNDIGTWNEYLPVLRKGLE